jgi:hypothetical protein
MVFGGASGLVAMAFSSFDPRKYGVFMVADRRSSWACPQLDSFGLAGVGLAARGSMETQWPLYSSQVPNLFWPVCVVNQVVS